VSSNDASDVAEANLPRCANGSSMMAAEFEVEPTDCDRELGIGIHCHEEQSTVIRDDHLCGCEEDGEAGDRHRNWDVGEEKAMLEQVRKVCYFPCKDI